MGLVASRRSSRGVAAPHRHQHRGVALAPPAPARGRRAGEASWPAGAARLARDDRREALRKIPAKQAAAIVLRHYHGYTNREIAAALGIPERTVASRLAAAKARLQVELADWVE
jgi:DNA-directed RNA polymerase specialized sigma24 family protein